MTATVGATTSVARLATRLRNRRIALGLSQQAVADLVGTTQSAISDWEACVHSMRMSTVERWCEALGFRLRCELDDWGREL